MTCQSPPRRQPRNRYGPVKRQRLLRRHSCPLCQVYSLALRDRAGPSAEEAFRSLQVRSRLPHAAPPPAAAPPPPFRPRPRQQCRACAVGGGGAGRAARGVGVLLLLAPAGNRRAVATGGSGAGRGEQRRGRRVVCRARWWTRAKVPCCAGRRDGSGGSARPPLTPTPGCSLLPGSTGPAGPQAAAQAVRGGRQEGQASAAPQKVSTGTPDPPVRSRSCRDSFVVDLSVTLSTRRPETSVRVVPWPGPSIPHAVLAPLLAFAGQLPPPPGLTAALPAEHTPCSHRAGAGPSHGGRRYVHPGTRPRAEPPSGTASPCRTGRSPCPVESRAGHSGLALRSLRHRLWETPLCRGSARTWSLQPSRPFWGTLQFSHRALLPLLAFSVLRLLSGVIVPSVGSAVLILIPAWYILLSASGSVPSDCFHFPDASNCQQHWYQWFFVV